MATQDHSIIPIISHTVSSAEEQCVDARDLHNFLKVGRDFSNWVKDRIEEYQFIDGQDFIVCSPKLVSKKRGGSNRLDYFLTLEMAKELAMVEKNDRGREARRYFIECERRAKQPRLDPEFLMIHKSVLRDTGRALVWMGDYGVTSQPYYGGAQPPFIDGRPVMSLSDNSTRYYLTKYVGNVMESQAIASEELLTHHLRRAYPNVEVVQRDVMRGNLMQLANQLVVMSGEFTTTAEINKGIDKVMAKRAA